MLRLIAEIQKCAQIVNIYVPSVVLVVPLVISVNE